LECGEIINDHVIANLRQAIGKIIVQIGKYFVRVGLYKNRKLGVCVMSCAIKVYVISTEGQ